MKLSEALSPTTWIPVHFAAGAVLNVEYRPASATIEEMEKLRADTEEEQTKRVIANIQSIVVDWDLTHDDGETKVGLDEQSLRRIPTNVFMEIIRAVGRHQSSGEAESSSRAG